MLSSLMLREPAHGIDILPPEAVDPVAWWNVPAFFFEERDPPPSPFMHMYATIWARRGVDAESRSRPPRWQDGCGGASASRRSDRSSCRSRRIIRMPATITIPAAQSRCRHPGNH